MTKLKSEGVFAKEVLSAGVAFHSYYMASIAPVLLSALQKVMLWKDPMLGRVEGFRSKEVTSNVRMSFYFLLLGYPKSKASLIPLDQYLYP